MATLARHAWFGHPHAPALLRFNLLPSRLFHPSRRHEWLPAVARALVDASAEPVDDEALHRHASSALLQRLELGMVQGLDDPALPVCLAGDETLERLALCCGLVALAPGIRRVIARDDVALLEDEIGMFGLQFARRVAPRLWAPPPGEGQGAAVPPAQARAQALRLGLAMLSAALAGATPPVARRGLLRLPADAADAIPELPPSLAHGPAALAVTLGILQELDPQWLSSFPAPR